MSDFGQPTQLLLLYGDLLAVGKTLSNYAATTACGACMLYKYN